MTEITENRVEATEAFHSINNYITNILSARISHSILTTIPQKERGETEYGQIKATRPKASEAFLGKETKKTCKYLL